MTQQNDNYETPPAVESRHYEGPHKEEQRNWNWGITTLIAGVAGIFLAVIVVYLVSR